MYVLILHRANKEVKAINKKNQLYIEYVAQKPIDNQYVIDIIKPYQAGAK
jgi:hypothetical protein